VHKLLIKKNFNNIKKLGANIEIFEAQQARLCNMYRNAKLKFLKANAAIWVTKMHKIKLLKPNYINIKINGN